jgi:hypothetical protein
MILPADLARPRRPKVDHLCRLDATCAGVFPWRCGLTGRYANRPRLIGCGEFEPPGLLTPAYFPREFVAARIWSCDHGSRTASILRPPKKCRHVFWFSRFAYRWRGRRRPELLKKNPLPAHLPSRLWLPRGYDRTAPLVVVGQLLTSTMIATWLLSAVFLAIFAAAPARLLCIQGLRDERGDYPAPRFQTVGREDTLSLPAKRRAQEKSRGPCGGFSGPDARARFGSTKFRLAG